MASSRKSDTVAPWIIVAVLVAPIIYFATTNDYSNNPASTEKEVEHAIVLEEPDAGETPSPADITDTTGIYGPRISPSGKLGVGIDLGNGLSISPSGGLGYGF